MMIPTHSTVPQGTTNSEKYRWLHGNNVAPLTALLSPPPPQGVARRRRCTAQARRLRRSCCCIKHCNTTWKVARMPHRVTAVAQRWRTVRSSFAKKPPNNPEVMGERREIALMNHDVKALLLAVRKVSYALAYLANQPRLAARSRHKRCGPGEQLAR